VGRGPSRGHFEDGRCRGGGGGLELVFIFGGRLGRRHLVESLRRGFESGAERGSVVSADCGELFCFHRRFDFDLRRCSRCLRLGR